MLAISTLSYLILDISGRVAANQLPTAQPAIARQYRCGGALYQLPSALKLDNLRPGLYISQDHAATYAVSGGSPATIRDQIRRCTPVHQDGVFAANTGYTLTSRYTYAPQPNGLCRVTKATVGLHLNQVFPAWSGDRNSAEGKQWQQFLAKTKLHEQGHVNLDKAYAARLYQAILATPPTPCHSLQATTDAIIRGTGNQLAEANDTYDAITEHGTTQGAVLQ